MLRGRRFDMDGGKRVKVVGKLRVIGHPAAVVNGVLVPASVELRVSEG